MPLDALSMKRLQLFFLLAAVLALTAGCGGGGKPKVPADAVAVVGGSTITKAEFNAELTTAKRSYKARHQPFPKAGTRDYTNLSSQLMQFLTERSIYEQQAKKYHVKVSDKDVDKRLQQIKSQYFVNPPGKPPATPKQIEKRYREQIAKSGLTDKDVRDGIRYQLIREAVYKKVTDSVKVSDSDIKKYYKDHKAQYQQPAIPESRDVRHILVKTQAQALRIYRMLKNGADFTKLVTKYSQDPGSKATGGKYTICKKQSVGCIKTLPQFEKVAFALKTNEISKPVHTKDGWHIIQALGPVKKAQKAKPIPFSQVKEAIRQQLLQTKRQQEAAKWWDSTKKDYAKKTSYQSGYAPPPTTTAAATTG